MEERQEKRRIERMLERQARQIESDRVRGIVMRFGRIYSDLECTVADASGSASGHYAGCYVYRVRDIKSGCLIRIVAPPGDVSCLLEHVIPVWLNSSGEREILARSTPDSGDVQGTVALDQEFEWYWAGATGSVVSGGRLVTWPRYFLRDGTEIARRAYVAALMAEHLGLDVHPLDIETLAGEALKCQLVNSNLDTMDELTYNALDTLLRISPTACVWFCSAGNGAFFLDDPLGTGDPVPLGKLYYDETSDLQGMRHYE